MHVYTYCALRDKLSVYIKGLTIKVYGVYNPLQCWKHARGTTSWEGSRDTVELSMLVVHVNTIDFAGYINQSINNYDNGSRQL